MSKEYIVSLTMQNDRNYKTTVNAVNAIEAIELACEEMGHQYKPTYIQDVTVICLG